MASPMRSVLIEAEARRWLGTPFAHQGRIRGEGVDCAGLVVQVAHKLGLLSNYEDAATYPRNPDGTMEKLLDQHLDRVAWAERKQGDIVHVAWNKLPQHIGILTSKDTLIHAIQGHGAIESHIAGRLRQGVRGVYRFRDF